MSFLSESIGNSVYLDPSKRQLPSSDCAVSLQFSQPLQIARLIAYLHGDLFSQFNMTLHVLYLSHPIASLSQVSSTATALGTASSVSKSQSAIASLLPDFTYPKWISGATYPLVSSKDIIRISGTSVSAEIQIATMQIQCLNRGDMSVLETYVKRSHGLQQDFFWTISFIMRLEHLSELTSPCSLSHLQTIST